MIVGIVGLGLIGGSIAKSLKKNRVCDEIIAYDRNLDDLIKAEKEGVIDMITHHIDASFELCDLIFICTPVEFIFDTVVQLHKVVRKQCLITDVGSTKHDIEKTIKSHFKDINYIGGHPMAGLEKSGYEFSSAILLENAFYLITSNSSSNMEKLNELITVIKAIKAIPIVIDADLHDYITANISHIPHIIAASLVNTVKNSDKEERYLHTLAAGGFKDITRIASSSPAIWNNICLSNKQHIISSLEKFKEEINKFELAIKTDDSTRLNELFSSSKSYRDSFEYRNTGLIEPVYDFSVSVEDKPGIIASISTILAKKNINIRNIGIINNREVYEGALRIEFNDESSKINAFEVLSELGYLVYLKSN
ncbi:MAG: prephenate dehydrogenase/arogenate dehydrogenase family protein [Clostridia bacterium]|nr:prephenate dehydrogenase/arogenate dehydrogenase family protein [Clostridia bacterium]